MNAAILGATVKSCAVVDPYPMPEIIVGRNKEKLCGRVSLDQK